GLTTSCANRRTLSRSSFCSSVSSILMVPGSYQTPRPPGTPRWTGLARILRGVFAVGRLVLHVAVLLVDLDLPELGLLGQLAGFRERLFLGVVLGPVGSVLLGDHPLLGRGIGDHVIDDSPVGFAGCRHTSHLHPRSLARSMPCPTPFPAELI